MMFVEVCFSGWGGVEEPVSAGQGRCWSDTQGRHREEMYYQQPSVHAETQQIAMMQ